MSDKIEKLKSLLKLVDESISRADFELAFKTLIDFVKKLKQDNTQEFEAIRQTIEGLGEKLAQDNELDFLMEKKKFGQAMEKALEDQRTSLNFLREKVSDLQAGRDGLDGSVGPQGAPGEAGSPDTPIQVRDKLEILQEDERLDWTAVKGVIGIHIGPNPPEDKNMLWVDTK